MNEAKQIQYNRLKTMTTWLDTKFQGPFGMRFGLDPIIGLVPILGDLVTLCFSIYILFNAFLLGCSYAVFLRMLLNIFIEFVVELIPGLGQVFDFFWKANTKNLQLLDLHIQRPQLAHRRSVWTLFFVFLTLITFVIVCISLAVVAVKYTILFLSQSALI